MGLKTRDCAELPWRILKTVTELGYQMSNFSMSMTVTTPEWYCPWSKTTTHFVFLPNNLICHNLPLVHWLESLPAGTHNGIWKMQFLVFQSW